MHRILGIMMIVAVTLTSTGCVAVIGSRTYRCQKHGETAVAMNGSIYVVDTKDYSVVKLDDEAIANAATSTVEQGN